MTDQWPAQRNTNLETVDIFDHSIDIIHNGAPGVVLRHRGKIVFADGIAISSVRDLERTVVAVRRVFDSRRVLIPFNLWRVFSSARLKRDVWGWGLPS